jgi:hypothetical protein
VFFLSITVSIPRIIAGVWEVMISASKISEIPSHITCLSFVLTETLAGSCRPSLPMAKCSQPIVMITRRLVASSSPPLPKLYVYSHPNPSRKPQTPQIHPFPPLRRQINLPQVLLHIPQMVRIFSRHHLHIPHESILGSIYSRKAAYISIPQTQCDTSNGVSHG